MRYGNVGERGEKGRGEKLLKKKAAAGSLKRRFGAAL